MGGDIYADPILVFQSAECQHDGPPGCGLDAGLTNELTGGDAGRLVPRVPDKSQRDQHRQDGDECEKANSWFGSWLGGHEAGPVGLSARYCAYSTV